MNEEQVRDAVREFVGALNRDDEAAAAKVAELLIAQMLTDLRSVAESLKTIAHALAIKAAL